METCGIKISYLNIGTSEEDSNPMKFAKTEQRRELEKGQEEAEKRFEDECILKCFSGDREAFRPLVEKYSKFLFVYAYRIVGSKDDAGEIVQEVFTKAYRNLASYNFRYRFSTWLCAIALNLCRDHIKRMKKEKEFIKQCDFSVVYQNEENVFENLDREKLKEKILYCMMNLPVMTRELIVLKDVMDLSYREMRQVLKVPVPLLKVKVMRARRKLCNMVKDCMGKEGRNV